MASIKAVLKKGITEMDEKEPLINELVEKAFTTRTLLHFAHLSTKSFASHMALGELYDQIVDDVDEIAETYMGKFGSLKDLECDSCGVPSDIIAHVKAEAAWVEANRSEIARGYTPIENLIDTLIGHYSKTIYKLENLH
jgi:hypothetical protein